MTRKSHTVSKCPDPTCDCNTCQWLRNRAVAQVKDGVSPLQVSAVSQRFLHWAKAQLRPSAVPGWGVSCPVPEEDGGPSFCNGVRQIEDGIQP
jgi:hypothetical protein